MHLFRPAFATHPRRFGRGPVRVTASPSAAVSGLSDDLKLFAATFVAGFVFVSILLA